MVFFDYLGVDAIIMGDGEEAVVEAAKCLSNEQELSDCIKVVTPNKPDCFNYILDIDSIHFPYRTPVNASIRRKIVCPPTASMITMRGCPYKCPFCVSGNLRGVGRSKYTKRSVKNIIDELRTLQSDGYHSVIFYDDCFFFGKDTNFQIKEFCNAFIDANLSLEWTMELRPDAFELLTNKSFELLAKTGCKEINIGFESTNYSTQQYFNKRYEIKKIAGQCKKGTSVGIAINGTFIIGGPNETIDTIYSTISASMELGLLFAHFTPLEIYPGTPLYASIYKEDDKMWFYLLKNDNLKWNEIIYENDIISSQKLIELASEAYMKFYLNPVWEKLVRDFFDKTQSEKIIGECHEMIKNRYNL